ncbi:MULTISPECIES: hypothetical protein [Amycolatopsis]|uniref:Uncharacterized protein n=1 Tax=Amycolatopsis albidoflavus TaxID=102226 RepID=A0ABW5I753_9PSEU
MLTLPYVTTASFKAYPTFLDVMNLRPGDPVLSDQDAELYNILLKSSAWADGYVRMSAGDGTLSAHTRVERARIRVARDGRISYHTNHNPVTAVTGLSIGMSPNQLTAVTDLTNLWPEDQRQIVGYPGGITSPGLAALQFGSPVVTGELYTQWTYIAGYANTLLGAAVASGASSITVADATGIAAGTVLRIWDPGHEEAVTVAAGYTTGTSIPLAGVLKFPHDPTSVAIGVSAIPSDVHLAVILYAVALLQRPDSEHEDSFPSTQVKPNTRVGTANDGSGFVVEAERLLDQYKRVR